jgi:transcriptional regulator with XRE-family HTH domain
MVFQGHRGERLVDPLSIAIGSALRRVRRSRGLTLRAVAETSGGVFKATSVAGYERGERSITVERFCGLCDVYRIAPEQLLGEITRSSRREDEPSIDLSALGSLATEEASLVSEFVQQVLALRKDPERSEISLRTGDLQVLATASGKKPEELLELLEPVLRKPS